MTLMNDYQLNCVGESPKELINLPSELTLYSNFSSKSEQLLNRLIKKKKK